MKNRLKLIAEHSTGICQKVRDWLQLNKVSGRWMDGWTDTWRTDGWMDGRMDWHTDGRMDQWLYRGRDVGTDRHTLSSETTVTSKRCIVWKLSTSHILDLLYLVAYYWRFSHAKFQQSKSSSSPSTFFWKYKNLQIKMQYLWKIKESSLLNLTRIE